MRIRPIHPVVLCSIALLLCLAADVGAQSARSLPLWFDVSAAQPPNIKINTDATTELQNEEQVAVDPTNPNNLVAVWRDFRLGYRQVGWGYSHDGGASWIEGGLIPSTPYDRDSDPAIVCNSQGVFFSVILSFQDSGNEDGLYIPVSYDSGLTWSFWSIAVENFNSLFEDKEMMAVDNTGGPTDGSVYVAWARFGATTDIYCVRSFDGITFDLERLVSDQSGVQWPVPAVGAGGRVVIAWWSYARGAIMCDISTDQGWTWGTDRVLQNIDFYPSQINGGITTFGFPALTADVTGGPFHGRFYCAFVDYGPDGRLDLYMTRSLDGGLTWTGRQRINDDPLGNGVDQFHPWIAVNPDGVVSVAFYDRRLDPANLNFDLFVTHSFDGGLTWTPNQRVSEVSSSPFNAFGAKSVEPLTPYDPKIPIAYSPNAGLIGEYIGIAASRLRATTVFTDTRNGHQDVYAANVPLRLFPPKLMAPADAAISTDPAPTLQWADWSIYDSACIYTVEYATDPDFAVNVTRQSGLPGYTLETTPLADGIWHWRVRATDPFGDSSAWSASRRVWVDATPPVVPALLPPSPLDGAVTIDATPEFFWSASPAGNGTPVRYTLEVARDIDFTQDARTYSDLSATLWTIPDADSLARNATWYWRVEAVDSAGWHSGWSVAEDFLVIPPYVLGDYNNDGFLDVVDVVGMVNVAFRGGTTPAPPPERMDVNCDGAYDVVDVVLLVNHIFRATAAPHCP
ncbi:MAG TPA: sialidase family protein [bacterium]|nr:sialidase family protein [bacterium]